MRIGLLAAVLLLAGWLPAHGEEGGMSISSPAFQEGAPIPIKYSRAGSNLSPPLEIRGLPANAVSYVILMDSPDGDAEVSLHWLAANYLASQAKLEAGVTPKEVVMGLNSWDHTRYDGPEPGKEAHRYFFRVYALDVVLDLKRGFTREDFITMIGGHLLGTAQMMGTFGGPK